MPLKPISVCLLYIKLQFVNSKSKFMTFQTYISQHYLFNDL